MKILLDTNWFYYLTGITELTKEENPDLFRRKEEIIEEISRNDCELLITPPVILEFFTKHKNSSDKIKLAREICNFKFRIIENDNLKLSSNIKSLFHNIPNKVEINESEINEIINAKVNLECDILFFYFILISVLHLFSIKNEIKLKNQKINIISINQIYLFLINNLLLPFKKELSDKLFNVYKNQSKKDEINKFIEKKLTEVIFIQKYYLENFNLVRDKSYEFNKMIKLNFERAKKNFSENNIKKENIYDYLRKKIIYNQEFENVFFSLLKENPKYRNYFKSSREYIEYYLKQYFGKKQ